MVAWQHMMEPPETGPKLPARRIRGFASYVPPQLRAGSNAAAVAQRSLDELAPTNMRVRETMQHASGGLPGLLCRDISAIVGSISVPQLAVLP